jgi:hypothetical protein
MALQQQAIPSVISEALQQAHWNNVKQQHAGSCGIAHGQTLPMMLQEVAATGCSCTHSALMRPFAAFNAARLGTKHYMHSTSHHVPHADALAVMCNTTAVTIQS